MQIINKKCYIHEFATINAHIFIEGQKESKELLEEIANKKCQIKQKLSEF